MRLSIFIDAAVNTAGFSHTNEPTNGNVLCVYIYTAYIYSVYIYMLCYTMIA